jgi:phage shock protein E
LPGLRVDPFQAPDVRRFNFDEWYEPTGDWLGQFWRQVYVWKVRPELNLILSWRVEPVALRCYLSAEGTMKKIGSLSVILIAGLMNGCGGSRELDTIHNTITTHDAAKLIDSSATVVILDVRTEAEYKSETGHLKGALLMPIQELESRLGELEHYKDKTILAYCRTGNRSGRAERILTQHGFHALNMLGGITQWNKEQLPVVKENQ